MANRGHLVFNAGASCASLPPPQVLLQLALVHGVKVLPDTQFVRVEGPGQAGGSGAKYSATVQSGDGAQTSSLPFHHLVGADGEHGE